MKCIKCKENKKIEELFGTGRFRAAYQGRGNPAKKNFEPYKTPLTPFKICRFCWPKTAECWAYKKYENIKWDYRWEASGNPELSYSYKDFWEWLKKDPKFKKAAQWKPNQEVSKSERLSIDRIDNNIGYELHNLQVITKAENSSKNDTETFTAFRVAMKFFGKLRKEQGLTKYEMARKLDILPQTYYYLEEKARGCSFEVLCLLHEKLGISWERLGDLIMAEVTINKKDKKAMESDRDKK